MGSQDFWTDQISGSASKLNSMTIISGTGAYLAALSPTYPGQIVSCNSTGGSGFTTDHAYLRNSTNTAWIDITLVAAHTHISDANGGQVLSIFSSNPTFCILQLTKTDDLKKAQWIETVTSTGTIEDNTDGGTGERSIRLRPNGTSGAKAQISYPHLKLDFSKKSYFQCKLRIETMSSLALHAGVGADDIDAADSNTVKYNAEVCTATNNNWFLRTASGADKSASDTGIAATTSRVSIKIFHLPDLTTPETDLVVDAGTTLQKSSHIPVSGATADNNIIKHSIKNSTAADRPLFHYGSRLDYYISDNWL